MFEVTISVTDQISGISKSIKKVFNSENASEAISQAHLELML